MSSTILGKADLDLDALTQEIDYLRGLPRLSEVYDEFSAGSYKNHSLWNSTGDAHDSRFSIDNPIAEVTEFGRNVPKIEAVLKEIFRWENVKMVRARNLVNAAIFPHRDFVEFDAPTSHNQRVFLALDSAPFAFHSDEAGVFSMRGGEVWFVDAAGVHSAANLTSDQRLHICIDFVFPHPVTDLRDVFNPSAKIDHDAKATFAVRPPLPDGFEDALRGMGRVLAPSNLTETLAQLTKLHFTYDSAPEDVWDWIRIAAGHASSEALQSRIDELHDHVLLQRKIDGGLDIGSWDIEDMIVSTDDVVRV